MRGSTLLSVLFDKEINLFDKKRDTINSLYLNSQNAIIQYFNTSKRRKYFIAKVFTRIVFSLVRVCMYVQSI